MTTTTTGVCFLRMVRHAERRSRRAPRVDDPRRVATLADERSLMRPPDRSATSRDQHRASLQQALTLAVFVRQQASSASSRASRHTSETRPGVRRAQPAPRAIPRNRRSAKSYRRLGCADLAPEVAVVASPGRTAQDGTGEGAVWRSRPSTRRRPSRAASRAESPVLSCYDLNKRCGAFTASVSVTVATPCTRGAGTGRLLRSERRLTLAARGAIVFRRVA
jgi:hypothetical protein